MTRVYTRKNSDTKASKLAEEFEEYYNQRIHAEPGIDRRAAFEGWANQKLSRFQLGIFKMYAPVEES